MSRLVRRIAAVLGALLTALALASCIGTRGPATITSDADLDAKIDNLSATGGSAPLRELTGFDWDTVYCFYEGKPADEINSLVGSTVLRPGSYLYVSGALAVFVKNGEVVKPVVVREMVFDGNRFGTGAIVERGRRLTEPAPGPPLPSPSG